ncbi:hypothetical protein M5D96_006161 [Drosophila gunungcola]|uniref:Uncharacterized protein n=1 Tax=Drosophila gunungcola TaxID=103775 RepID=A0A9Q0BPW3_9MUSC|nr:hypothetical protein M5D96_006161 [Drosophila gunungcola]
MLTIMIDGMDTQETVLRYSQVKQKCGLRDRGRNKYTF